MTRLPLAVLLAVAASGCAHEYAYWPAAPGAPNSPAVRYPIPPEAPRGEVYVTSFPALDQKLKVTDAGGGRPRWRRDSKEILFIGLQSPVFAVDFMPGPKINAGIPRQLYSPSAPGGAVPTVHRWDVSADGQRFFHRTAASIASFFIREVGRKLFRLVEVCGQFFQLIR